MFPYQEEASKTAPTGYNAHTSSRLLQLGAVEAEAVLGFPSCVTPALEAIVVTSPHHRNYILKAVPVPSGGSAAGQLTLQWHEVGPCEQFCATTMGDWRNQPSE